MTNKEKLFEDINPHTQYWDCYNDEPLEYDHTGKVIKICKKFTVSFALFCAENYIPKRVLNKPIIWEGNKNAQFTTEELLKIYLKNGTEI